MCEICSKLARHQKDVNGVYIVNLLTDLKNYFGVFIVNYEQADPIGIWL